MDLFDKLNAGLEPLGGPLFVDAFVTARQVEHAKQAAAARKPKAAVMQAAQGSSRAASAPSRKEPSARAAAPKKEPEPPAQDELEAFLIRDAIEGADDAEIQEFLKERSGFDPTELE